MCVALGPVFLILKQQLQHIHNALEYKCFVHKVIILKDEC
jgi:hypothetical protein